MFFVSEHATIWRFTLKELLNVPFLEFKRLSVKLGEENVAFKLRHDVSQVDHVATRVLQTFLITNKRDMIHQENFHSTKTEVVLSGVSVDVSELKAEAD